MTTTDQAANDSSSPFTALLGLLPGAVGGVCNVFVGHPIDLVKVRMQTMATSPLSTVPSSTLRTAPSTISRTTLVPTSTVGMLRQIALTEGLPGLYAGVTAPLLAVVPAFAVSFWSFELGVQFQLQYHNGTNHSQQSSSSSHNDLTLSQIACAGALSGLPLALVLAPLERIKCLMQVRSYPSFANCVTQVVTQGGWRSLYRGGALTVLRDVPGNAAYFGGYHATKRALLQTQPQQSSSSSSYDYYYSLAVTLFAGGMAGMANWIVAIPMDVIKSRWQTGDQQYASVGHVVRDLLEKEGPRALFRGLGPALLRAFPANAACLWGVETTQQAIDRMLG